MFSRLAAVVQDVGIGATGVFQGIGQNREQEQEKEIMAGSFESIQERRSFAELTSIVFFPELIRRKLRFILKYQTDPDNS